MFQFSKFSVSFSIRTTKCFFVCRNISFFRLSVPHSRKKTHLSRTDYFFIMAPKEEAVLKQLSDDNHSSESLYQKLGGVPAVKAVIEEFYGRILGDDKLAFFFQDVKMANLKLHQLEFMKIAFTEIPEGLDVAGLMLDKHRRLFVEKGLNETHFDLVAGHFVGACQHLNVPQNLIDEAVGVIGPLRPVFEEGGKLAEHSTEEAKAIQAEEEKGEDKTIDHEEDKNNSETLLSKIGGIPALKAAVGEFYDRIMADESLSPFFEDTNMTMIKMHQLKFLEIAFTKIPDDLDVAGMMHDKHARLFDQGLNESHFDSVAGHFVATLEHLQVPQEHIDSAVAIVVPLRPIFVQGAINAKK